MEATLSPLEFALNLLMTLSYFGLIDTIERDVTSLGPAETTSQLERSGMMFSWKCRYLSENVK